MNVEVNEDELRYKKKFTNYIVWYLVVLTLLGFLGINYILIYESFMKNIGIALIGIHLIAILILIFFLLAFFVFKKSKS